MNTYALVLTYAIPGFVVLIIIEYVLSLILGKKVANSMDTIASLSSGLTNTLKDVLKLAVVIVGYQWMHRYLALITIESTINMYIVCFILIDFASYWSHRFNHEINLFWNRHIIHHSSEEFNLACALRQSISGIVGIYFFLYVPMAIVGVDPTVVSVIAPLHLFAQFWYHTRLIKRMGPLELIIVTPSHHRVHHAINPEYIDKNYAAIFIIWDKLFGTFKEEDNDIPPVYGVKKPVLTWNPYIINFQHVAGLFRDAWYTQEWIDKLKIWFMPTGWRPKDVAERFPLSTIEDVYEYKKYAPNVPTGLRGWSWIQLLTCSALMYYMLINIDDLTTAGIGLYAAFIGASIFGYTSLMDMSKLALGAELVKCALCLTVFLLFGSWFEVGNLSELWSYFVPIYSIVSFILAFYFLHQKKRSSTELTPQLV